MPSPMMAGCLVPRLNGTFKATVRLTLLSISPSGQCLDGEIFLAIHRAGRAKPDSVRRPPDRGQGQCGCLNSELGRANVSSIALAKEEAQRRWQSGRCRVHITHRYAPDCGLGLPASDWLPPSPRFRRDKCDRRGNVLSTQRSEGASLATPGNHPVRAEESSRGSRILRPLSQTVHHALKWPIVGVFD
jgi:hypothetical protein